MRISLYEGQQQIYMLFLPGKNLKKQNALIDTKTKCLLLHLV